MSTEDRVMFGQRVGGNRGWGEGTLYQNVSSFSRTLNVEGSTYREGVSQPGAAQ